MNTLNIYAIYNSLIGAIAGGFFVVFGVFIAYYLRNKQLKKEQEQNVTQVIQIIYYEIKTFWDIYTVKIGNEIELQMEKKEPYANLKFIDWLSDSFSIYSSNSSHLSYIRADISKSIIEFYMQSENIIRTLDKYEKIFRRLERVNSDYLDMKKKTSPKMEDLQTKKVKDWRSISNAENEPHAEILETISEGGLKGENMFLKLLATELCWHLYREHKQLKTITIKLMKDLEKELEKRKKYL